jgi:hypothetical protein
MLRFVPVQYRRFYIEIKGDFDGYLANLSPKSRSTLRRNLSIS